MENQKENESIEADDIKEKKSPNIFSRFNLSPAKIKRILIVFSILVITIGGYYWYTISQRVYSDKAEIFAPLILDSFFYRHFIYFRQ